LVYYGAKKKKRVTTGFSLYQKKMGGSSDKTTERDGVVGFSRKKGDR